MQAVILADSDRAPRGRPRRVRRPAAGAVRGRVRGHGGPAGDDPAARPSAARVPPAGDRRRGAASSGRASRSPTICASSSARSTRCAASRRSIRCSARAAAAWASSSPTSTAPRSSPSRAPPAPFGSGPASAPQLEVMIPLVDYERELEIVRELIVETAERRGPARRRGLQRRHDDRAAARVPQGRLHRRPRRLLLVRDQRPDPDGAGLLARRHREAHPRLLPRPRRPRPLAVRHHRRAGRRPARAHGSLARAPDQARTSSSGSAASTAATPTRSPSFTRAGSTT